METGSNIYFGHLIVALGIAPVVVSVSQVALTMVLFLSSLGFVVFWDKFGPVYAAILAILAFTGLRSVDRKSQIGFYPRSTFWIVFYLEGLFIFYMLAGISGHSQWETAILFHAYFVIVLPLVNAPMDWLSLGVARGLLQAVHRGEHNGFVAFGFGLLNFILAVGFLVVMATLVVASASAANRSFQANDGAPLIDLSSVFTQLAYDPRSINQWWMYVMLVTTLVPTFIHLVLVGGAIILWLPRQLIGRAAVGWPTDRRKPLDLDKLTAVCAYVTVAPILLCLGFFGTGWLLYYLLGSLWAGEFATVCRTLLEFLIALNDWIMTVKVP
jgi:hypothetical protein